MFRRRPVLTAYLIAAVAWVGLAVTAMAEESTMHRPIEAASLHGGPLDMVSYFQPDAEGRLVVTATFVGRDAGAEPMRVVLPLADGDDVAFSMPGHLEALYRFTRAGAAVTVSVREARPWRAVAGL
jgi:hypothetical protein